MVERLSGMPAGTIGFRVSGRLTRDEYFEIVTPVQEALDRGEPINFLFVNDPDFHGIDLAALWEDAKRAPTMGLKHRSSWKRFAVVTDKDWIRHGVSAFGWLSPGEIRLFELDELDDAKAWVAES
jgi:hypothetical protein